MNIIIKLRALLIVGITWVYMPIGVVIDIVYSAIITKRLSVKEILDIETDCLQMLKDCLAIVLRS